jgi:hypothetical protein
MLSDELSSRRFGLGDILDGAWQVFTRRPWTFLLLGMSAGVFSVLLPPGPEQPKAGDLPGLMGWMFLGGLICSWTGLAAIWLADREVAGERPGIAAALAASLRVIVQYVLTGVLFFLVAVVPFVLLFTIFAVAVAIANAGHVPSAATMRVVIGLGALLFVPMCALCAWFALAPQVVVLRGAWGWASLRGSMRLVRGRFWRVLGILVVLMIPATLLSILATITPHTRLVHAAWALPGIGLSSFVTICLTLLFLDLDAVRPAPARPETAAPPIPPTEPVTP